MYVRIRDLFRGSWLYDTPVSGPSFFNERIVEDAEENEWEAADVHWNVYFQLDNPVTEAGENLHWNHMLEEWEMEENLEEKWGFGYVLKS